jgi:hypothetical protein
MRLTREQVRQTLTSPIIYIDIQKSEIESRKENYLFCSSGYEDKAYKGTIIIDSVGHILKIKRVFPIGKLLFWTSLRWFTPLREVEPEIEGDVNQVSVDELKEFVIEAISRKKTACSSLDKFENISSDIKLCKTHKDIIIYFNSGLK